MVYVLNGMAEEGLETRPRAAIPLRQQSQSRLRTPPRDREMGLTMQEEEAALLTDAEAEKMLIDMGTRLNWEEFGANYWVTVHPIFGYEVLIWHPDTESSELPYTAQYNDYPISQHKTPEEARLACEHHLEGREP